MDGPRHREPTSGGRIFRWVLRVLRRAGFGRLDGGVREFFRRRSALRAVQHGHEYMGSGDRKRRISDSE